MHRDDGTEWMDGLKLIDFGISCSHSDIGTFVDRSTIEYITPRIYLFKLSI